MELFCRRHLQTPECKRRRGFSPLCGALPVLCRNCRAVALNNLLVFWNIGLRHIGSSVLSDDWSLLLG